MIVASFENPSRSFIRRVILCCFGYSCVFSDFLYLIVCVSCIIVLCIAVLLVAAIVSTFFVIYLSACEMTSIFILLSVRPGKENLSLTIVRSAIFYCYSLSSHWEHSSHGIHKLLLMQYDLPNKNSQFN